MLGVTDSASQEGMKRSTANGEEAPHAKRKRVQPEDLDMDSTQNCVQLQTVTKDQLQDSIIERPYSTQPAECGVIEKILLINFMCHKRLEVNFNTNVNFVHGRNGSGKSAIMTATVVGLGGKATATSRGSSLKSFIQSGSGFAEISIWLKNGGPDAYRPDVYGGSIEVVRRIMTDGAGAYKIKSCRGQVISSKKEELTNILDQFNIQVDNPVSLLNQDTSRNFLHVTDAKAKYKLFMRATQLDHIAHEFERIEASCTRHKVLVANKEKEIDREKAGIKELEDQWKSLERLREMEGQVDHLRQEMQWAFVSQIEADMQEQRARIDKESEKIPSKEQRLREVEASRRPVEEQRETCEGQLRGVVDQLKEMEEEKKGCEEERRAKERAHMEKIKHCKQRTRSRADVLSEKKTLQKKIDEMKEKQRQKDIQNTKTAERARRQMDLEELRRDVSELKSHKASHVEMRSQLEHSLEENRRLNADKRRYVSSLAQKISEQQHTIQRLQSARLDRLRGFGEWMPQLIQAINQAGRQFSRKPVGPIGAYLKLKNEKYAFAVEHTLGGSFLTCFLCNNHRDRVALQKIFHQVIRNKQAFPEIITAPFQDHAYRDAPLPQVPYPTVMSMLTIDNVLVGNQLLERRMNSVLLIDTAGEAREFMFKRCPPGYRMAYTPDGSQATRDGSFYSGPYRNQAVYLQASNEETVRELEGEMQQWVNEKQALESSLSSVSTQEGQDRAELSRLQQLVAQESQKERVLSRKMMALETELAVSDDEEEEEYDIGTLEDEISVLDQDVADITEDIRVAEEAVRQAKVEVVSVANSIGAIQDRINLQIGEVENLSAAIQKLESDLGKVDYRCDQYRRQITVLRDNIAKLERNLEQQQGHLEKATQGAAALSKERIETTKSPEALDRQIKQLTLLLATEKDSLKDLEDVRAKFHQKLSWYQETVQHIKDSKRLLKSTKNGMKVRYATFGSVQEMITLRAAVYFKDNLLERGYVGELLFDHEKETLELKVQVDTAAAKSSAKNQKALSGGERSFATVCFVMSLWDAIEAPFRVLDEFDVFMDMVNRKMSMRLLLQSAEKSAGRQYIFLTPQNMSDLVPMDKSRLSVFVLEPPERRASGH